MKDKQNYSSHKKAGQADFCKVFKESAVSDMLQAETLSGLENDNGLIPSTAKVANAAPKTPQRGIRNKFSSTLRTQPII